MLNHITIQNYRNIDNIDNTINTRIAYLIEPNGTGKTNFLESIYFAIFNSSFRSVETIPELIGKENPFFKIELSFENNFLVCIVSNLNGRISRKFTLNNKKIGAQSIPFKFGVLLFAPHSVDLALGEPSIRRKDLDNFLSICFDRYNEEISQYSKVLKNRNAVIKMILDGKSNRSELTFWTEKLVNIATLIYTYRFNFFKEINQTVNLKAQAIYHDFKSLELLYTPNLNIEPENFKEALLNKYRENQEKEIIVGKTLYGVHKDDYKIMLNGKDLKFYGSRGQQRIGSFLLKISQSEYYKKLMGNPPLLLIDDIMSELDESHRLNISNFLLTLENQIIITAAVDNEMPDSIKNIGIRINLKK